MIGVLSVGQGMYNDSTLDIAGPYGEPLADEIRDRLGTQLSEAAAAGYGYAAEPVAVPGELFAPGLVRDAGVAEAVTGHVRYESGTFERFNAARSWEVVKVPRARKDEAVALLGIRDAARAVIDSQRSGAPASERDSSGGAQ